MDRDVYAQNIKLDAHRRTKVEVCIHEIKQYT